MHQHTQSPNTNTLCAMCIVYAQLIGSAFEIGTDWRKNICTLSLFLFKTNSHLESWMTWLIWKYLRRSFRSQPADLSRGKYVYRIKRLRGSAECDILSTAQQEVLLAESYICDGPKHKRPPELARGKYVYRRMCKDWSSDGVTIFMKKEKNKTGNWQQTTI